MELLQELEIFAKEYDVPIVEEEVRDCLAMFLRIQQPKRLLELGTAIGYSAIFFATLLPEVEIITIERDDAMAFKAKENIKKARLTERITLLHGDAKELLPTLDGFFDAIFMDAAKGQYNAFFTLLEPLWKPGGVLYADDVYFHGMLHDKEKYHKRKVTIVKRLRQYLQMIQETEGYESIVLPVGDGLAVTRKED